MYIQTFLSAGRKTWLERENLRDVKYIRDFWSRWKRKKTLYSLLSKPFQNYS